MGLRKLFSEENVGGVDLALRAFAGSVAVVALALHLIPPKWAWLAALIAFGGLYTSITKHCTPYALFGFSTKKRC